MRSAYPDASKLPKGDIPNFIVKILGVFDARVKAILPDIGTLHMADTNYVSALTKVIPRPAKEAILAAAESMKVPGKL